MQAEPLIRREPDYEGRESRKLYQQGAGGQVRQQMAEPERAAGADTTPRQQFDCGEVFWSWAMPRT